MELKEGYLYHLNDEYFKLINDDFLMKNKTGKRPSYLVIKDDETDILWFLPLSTKVSKYRKIREHKLKRYGKCTTILIVKIAKKEQAILIQNAFPTILKYVDTFHMIDNVPVHVTSTLKKEIEYNFKETLIAHNNGTKLFYSDIDEFKKIMLEELEKNKVLI